MRKHLPALAILVLVVSLLYVRTPTAYFCGYDDFAAMYRSHFEDTDNPSRIFTTTDFGQAKYRPVERGLLYLMHRAFGPNPEVYRIRNLLALLLSASMVYGIAWLLFRKQAVAFGAALLYGVHPIANQAVMGAVWSLASIYALVLTALFLFLLSLEVKQRWWLPLTASILLIWAGLFIYEAILAYFGFLFGYLVFRRLRGRGLPAGYLITAVGLSLAAAGSLFVIRHLFVNKPAGMVPLPIVIRNAAMYAAALVSPFDAVFANAVLGTPLPSEIRLSTGVLMVTLVLAIVLAAGVWMLSRLAWVRERARQVEWLELAFLVGAIAFFLSPFLGFTNHPSETYLYFPAALYTIVLCRLLYAFSKTSRVYTVIVVALAALFVSATWVRTSRVLGCATTVETILTHLPLNQWRTGEHTIRLAPWPEDYRPVIRYGLYGYHGLASLDPGVREIPAAQSAIRILTNNKDVTAEVVTPGEMRDCVRPGTCFWITDHGEVRDVVAGVSRLRP